MAIKPAACLALLALSACAPGPTDQFDFVQSTSVQLAAADTAWTLPVDLSRTRATSQYAGWTPLLPDPEIHQFWIDSISLQIGLTGADNAAGRLSGTVALRPADATDDSRDVVVGSLDALTIGHGVKATFSSSPAIDAFLLPLAKSGPAARLVLKELSHQTQPADFALNVEIKMTAVEYGR